ncbi:MAG: cell division protein FtsW [Chlamydiales bacterium]|nr:cell division protein FtsW [Chlamydiales bacterium]
MRSIFSRLSFSSYGLLFCVLSLFSLGLLMIYNTTSAEALDFERIDKVYHATVKQSIFALFGIVLASFTFMYGIEKLYNNIFSLFFLWVLVLFFTLVPHIGMELNGARRWIKIIGISIQPSEFAKIIIPIYFMRIGLETKLDLKTFLKYLGIVFIPIFFILVEPDNGTALIIIATLMTLFFLLRIPMIYWLVPLVVLVLLGGSYAIRSPHVQNRIQIYLHPEEDLLGKGHQPFQAKIAAGSGGVFGRGLGSSLQKLNYLPEARSDYIAAIFAEEFGFIGIVFLLSMYLFLVAFGFQIAFKAVSEKAYLIAAILTFLIGFQAFLNLGVVSGLLPSKGTNLPFFSQGGSSLCANFIIIALLLSIDYSSVRKRNLLFLCQK